LDNIVIGFAAALSASPACKNPDRPTKTLQIYRPK
jgi:hypothetical protein